MLSEKHIDQRASSIVCERRRGIRIAKPTIRPQDLVVPVDNCAHPSDRPVRGVLVICKKLGSLGIVLILLVRIVSAFTIVLLNIILISVFIGLYKSKYSFLTFHAVILIPIIRKNKINPISNQAGPFSAMAPSEKPINMARSE